MRRRAIIYGWDGEPMTELVADSEQELTERIGSELHQILVSDSDRDLSFRVQIMDYMGGKDQ